MPIKITRNLLRQYYGIGSTPTYHLCTPFTKLNEENNPEKDDSAFINDVNSSPSIIGYKNGFTFEAQVHEGDEVVDDLMAISREQKTGSDAERYIVDVDMNKEDGVTSGSYYARRFKVAVECTPPAGDPKSITKMTGTMHQIGDVGLGLFAVATKTWSVWLIRMWKISPRRCLSPPGSTKAIPRRICGRSLSGFYYAAKALWTAKTPP